MVKDGRGWPNEPVRHGLAAKGIKTGRKQNASKEEMPHVFINDDEFVKWTPQIKRALVKEVGPIRDFEWISDWTSLGHFRFKAEDDDYTGKQKEDAEFEGAVHYRVARSIARQMIEQDLTDEPEIFNQTWLGGHVVEERFWDDMALDIEEQVRDSPESFMSFLDGEEPEDEKFSDEQVEEMASGYLNDLKNQGVMDYLRELGYTGSDLFAQISPYLDIQEAAGEAMDIDGEGHFLSSYDGVLRETASNPVYWRVN